jgi:hypothetical protein
MASPYVQEDTLESDPLLNGSYEVTDSALGVAVTSITAAGFLGIMGSLVSLGTSGVGAMTQQAFTFGQVAVPGNPRNFLRLAWTTAATAGTPQYAHKIEDVRTFAGQKVTLQGFIRSDKDVPVRLRQDFGTGGSPSADVAVASDGPVSVIQNTVDANGTAQWRPFTIMFNLPSVAGKTIGTTANTSYVAFDVLPALNVLYQIDFTRLRLIPAGERSPVLTKRVASTEEKLLGRYYQSFGMFVFSGGTSSALPFGPMRAAPVMSGTAGAVFTGSTVSTMVGTNSGVSALMTGMTADARIAD